MSSQMEKILRAFHAQCCVFIAQCNLVTIRSSNTRPQLPTTVYTAAAALFDLAGYDYPHSHHFTQSKIKNKKDKTVTILSTVVLVLCDDKVRNIMLEVYV